MTRLARGIALAATVLLAACAGNAPVPGVDMETPPAPDLSGRAVMLLPAHGPPPGSTLLAGAGEPVPGLDAELAFFLAGQAPSVRWVTADVVKQAAARAPFLDVHPEALAVSDFHFSQLRRIGDPLWGDLRKLGTLLDARFAILPFAAGFAPDSMGTGRVEIGAAIIDTGNGNVLWIGYAAGEPGGRNARAVIASAAQALARKVAP